MDPLLFSALSCDYSVDFLGFLGVLVRPRGGLGVMLLWSLSPSFLSSVRWLAMLVLLLALVGNQRHLKDVPLVAPLISSGEVLICRRISDFSLAREVIVVMKKGHGRGGALYAVIGDGAHHRQNPRIGYGPCYGGRWLASIDDLLNLMAEWRPILFLLAMEPEGRQSSFELKSMAWSHGDFVAPSGVVPGGVGIDLARKLQRTQLLFFFALWGLLCLNQDLVCISCFYVGLFVM